MIISIVTISYNQAPYLERAICSIINQGYEDLEFIIVDPGSTDGSREIISKYRHIFKDIILEPDNGPANGLNKGFKKATGDVYGFLNADDILLPNALNRVSDFLSKHKEIDILSGHSAIIDQRDRKLRSGKSAKFSLYRYAYGAAPLMQPSTFFRSDIYKKVKGFNELNRSNWDGELFVDMAFCGANFGLTNEYLSGYRLHKDSITGSKKMDAQIEEFHDRMFARIMKRHRAPKDRLIELIFKIWVYSRDPVMLYERIAKGPIYGTYQS